MGLHEELLQAKIVWDDCFPWGVRGKRVLAELRTFRCRRSGVEGSLADFVQSLPSHVVLEARRGPFTAGGAPERRGGRGVTLRGRRYHALGRAGRY